MLIELRLMSTVLIYETSFFIVGDFEILSVGAVST